MGNPDLAVKSGENTRFRGRKTVVQNDGNERAATKKRRQENERPFGAPCVEYQMDVHVYFCFQSA